MKNLKKYLNMAQLVVITASAVISAIAGALGYVTPLEAGAIGGSASAAVNLLTGSAGHA